MKREDIRFLIQEMSSEKAAAEILGVPYSEIALMQLPWTIQREYLDFLVSRDISSNVASFVGATTIRIHEIGASRPVSHIRRMRKHVGPGAAGDGVLGLGFSLIYALAFCAHTKELVVLSEMGHFLR